MQDQLTVHDKSILQGCKLTTVGENRGAPRIWLEGKLPDGAGFTPGSTYSIHYCDQRNAITLTLDEDGKYRVSSKCRNDRRLPVIDLCSIALTQIVVVGQQARIMVMQGCIVITPTASAQRLRERLERLHHQLAQGCISAGSVSHGGGILSHALHDAFWQNGLVPELRFANDIREELLEHASVNNEAWSSGTALLAVPLQELAFDDDIVARLPRVELLEAGLPCSGASVAGRAKRGLSMPEAHPEVGHLMAGFLTIIARSNPVAVILENVPSYQDCASAWMFRHQLRDWGYVVHELILRGADWNVLEHRDRLCLLAVTHGIEFDAGWIEKPAPSAQRLGDVLEDLAADDPRWSTMTGLKAKEERDRAAGKGFRMQIFGPEATRIGTLTKAMQKNRSTDPKIRHPEDPTLLRIPTPREHARCKGIPVHLAEGLPNTTAHEVLGQSVIWPAFHAVGHALYRALSLWFAGGHAGNSSVRRYDAACG